MSLLVKSIFISLILILVGCNASEDKIAPMVIGGITPPSADVNGNIDVVISGQNLTFIEQVKFGNSVCTDLVAISSSKISCKLPPRDAPGTVTVSVKGKAGRQAFSTFHYYKTNPEIDSLSTTMSALDGNTVLFIYGQGFHSGSIVRIGGEPCSLINVVSPSLIECMTPPMGVGSYPVTVTNPNGESAPAPVLMTYHVPPSVVSVTPNTGSITGGQELTITGSDFLPGAKVKIGPYLCAMVEFINSNTLKCTTLAGSEGTFNVAVENPDTQSGSLNGAFSYFSTPTITDITPLVGPVAGGNDITLTGVNFSTGTTVEIGGTPCLSLNFVSKTSLICRVPPKAEGTYPVTAANPGSPTTTFAFGYSYHEEPVISSIVPNVGTIMGGTLITITGNYFRTGVTVTIDGAQCLIEAQNATTIQCKTPARIAGSYDVVVRNVDGQSSTASSAFTYQEKPSIISVSPAAGDIDGGNVVTITGTNIYSPSVMIGDSPCTVTASTTTSVTCTTSAGTAGVKDVTLTNNDTQTATYIGGFTYLNDPVFAAVNPIVPPSGGTSGGTEIQINGDHFFTGATVNVGGAECTGVVVESKNLIRCLTPAGTLGAKDVVVTNVSGQSATLVNGFTYRVPPSISSITPDSAVSKGGTSVTITGSDFDPDVTVKLGSANCNILSVTSTQIVCTTTAHAPGYVTVTVTNNDGQFDDEENFFRFLPGPVITEIIPNKGSATDPTPVVIKGTNLSASTVFDFGANPCLSVTVNIEGDIECTVQPHTQGTYDVIATNTDTQTMTFASGFSFYRDPVLNSVTPSFGPLTGGTVITLVGDHFVAGTTVTIGGEDCTELTIVDTQTMTCKTPAGADGATTLSVINPIGRTASTTFTYQLPPSIISVVPDNGALAGGDLVTVNGTNFADGATVSFGGSPCQIEGAITSGSLTCRTTAHVAGAVNVTVTNVDGQSGSLNNAYRYNAFPIISDVSPSIVPSVGGKVISISGSNFVGSTVTIGGALCLPQSQTATLITCITPPGPEGDAEIVVTNSDGQSVTFPSASFRYLNAPSIASISPGGGPLTGGTLLTIYGADFEPGVSVTLNGNACTSVNLVNENTITCITPAGAIGPAILVVKNFDGQMAINASLFSYSYPPVISDIIPAFGPMGGGTTITLNGTNFKTGAKVRFGSAEVTTCTITGVTAQCTLPSSLTKGLVDVEIINPDSQSYVITQGFTYLAPPVLSKVSPAIGAPSTSSLITLEGSEFVPGATVTVGGQPCTDVKVLTDQSLTCRTSASLGLGTYQVVVTNIDGQTASLATGYSVVNAPVVTSVTPDNGPTSGGTIITITGQNFYDEASVQIGTSPCNDITVVNTTTITCKTGASNLGSFPITVRNVDQRTGVSTGNIFTFRTPATITSIAPLSGGQLGGNTVYVYGSGFINGDTVSIGGISCTTTIFDNSGMLRCIAPGGVPGTHSVTVSNGSMSATLASAYTYNGLPTITGISPSNGPQAGNTLVTITGTGFISGATVTIGGNACTSLTVVSPTVITCRTAVHAPGVVNVVVTNPNTPSVTLPNGYTYTNLPILEFVVGSASPTPPNPDNFGTTSVNIGHTFTIRNRGESTSSAISVTMEGENPGAFLLDAVNCEGQTLDPGETCTVQVTFIPGLRPSGVYKATLTATAASGGTITNEVEATKP